MSRQTLEPTAQEIAGATPQPPFPEEPGGDGARNVPDNAQAAPVAGPDLTPGWADT
jgi:acetyl esterase